MSGEESVKVAVRVRPFNKRERQRNAVCILEMSGATTTITNPDDLDDVRKFNFDYSYWSHDGATEENNGYFSPKPDTSYIGQKEVFNDVGVGILKNAWEGYNTSLFAYGQTGSGKSWSVVGYSANKGIVPRFCETIFKEISEKKQQGNGTEYEVVFSMLEIYNERVHDLLNPKGGKKSLKVRQHPKKGFYADGLLVVPVKDYADIEMRMEEGTKNRTIAATNMNATSSRAHTIVGVTFIQKIKNAAGEETAKSSVVNLVDLAGSERADSTGATGDRLKEGAAINQSLSSLGNCIAALAERSEGKKVRVPFRDSVLTKLLKNALGGNSKTIMIAALSPADINYEETLSTLRYADRAKQIKTKATINEDPTEKLIRDLQEENEKLKALLASGGKIEKINSEDDDDDDDDESGLSEEEIKARVEEELAARMAENERMVKEMEQKWEEKLATAENENKEKDEKERQLIQQKKSTPHLYNLSPDPMLTGMVVHLLKKGINKIGKSNQDPQPDIPLLGINIRPEHGEISFVDEKVYKLRACADARLLINGQPVTGEIELHHHDRILLGSSHLYIFANPEELEKLKSDGVEIVEVSYEAAQEEIAKNSGVNMKKSSQSNFGDVDDIVLTEDLTDFLPSVSEANGISEELDKKVQFEAVVLSGQVRGKSDARNEIFVKVTQLDTGYIWFWTKQKFINRKYVMQEMFEDFQNGEEWKVPVERDPFLESPDTESLVGVCEIFMKCITYMIDLSVSVPVVDYRGAHVGTLDVSVLPCKEDGTELHEQDCYLDTPDELEGKRIDFKVMIKAATGLPKRYTDIYCKYDLFTYESMKTGIFSESVDVTFAHTKQLTVDKCSKKILSFLTSKPMIIQIWGKQKPGRVKPVNNAAKLGQTTRDIMKAEALRKSQGGKATKKSLVDANFSKNMVENMVMKKRMEGLQKKLLKIKDLCDKEEKKGETKVTIVDVREILGNVAPATSDRSSSQSSSSSSSSDDESTPYKYEKEKRKKKVKTVSQTEKIKKTSKERKESKLKDESSVKKDSDAKKQSKTSKQSVTSGKKTVEEKKEAEKHHAEKSENNNVTKVNESDSSNKKNSGKSSFCALI